MYLIHEFHHLSWITEITELFHDILIYWDAPVCLHVKNTSTHMPVTHAVCSAAWHVADENLDVPLIFGTENSKYIFLLETSWNVDSSEHSTHFQCLLSIWGELWPREPSKQYNWCTAFFLNRLTQFNYHLFTFILFLLFFLHQFLGEGAQQYNSA